MSTDSRKVREFVAAQRRLTIARLIASRALLILSIFFLAASALHVIFAAVPWTLLPVLWDLCVAGCALALAVVVLDTSVWRAPRPVDIARELERRSGDKHPLLSISLELDSPSGEPAGGDLVSMVHAGAASRIASLSRQTGEPTLRRRMLAGGGTLLIWSAVVLFLVPRVESYWKMPSSFFGRAGARIQPGSVVVARHSSVRLSATPSGGTFPSCRLLLENTGGKEAGNYLLRPGPSGIFSFKLDSIEQSVTYRFVLGGRATSADTITVIPPPGLYRLQVELVPPKYMGAPSRILPEGQGNFSAYAGTRARVTTGSNVLQQAWIISGGDTLPMTLGKATATAELTIWKPCSYTFRFVDTLRQQSDSLPVFHVGVIADEIPAVQLLKPGRNRDLTAAQVETLWVEAVDDIGIRELGLQWRRGGDAADTGYWGFPLDGSARTVRREAIWNLRELSLYPGDTVYYWARARDNKPFGAAQVAFSDTFWFRVPSFEEIHQEIAQRESYAGEKVGQVREKQDQLGQMLEKLVKSATGNDQLTWEQKQIVDDIKKTVQEQSDSLQRALESLQENVDQMKKEGVLGDETMQKMDQVRKALEELVREFGDSLLFDMNERDREISWKEMAEAVEKARDMLPELNERLENTLRYLEMIKRDSRLSSLAARAQNLSKEQMDLSMQPPTERSADLEKDLLDRIDDLSSDVASEMSDSGSSIDPSDIPSSKPLDSLQRAMRAPLSNRTLPSAQSMQQMSSTLLSMSSELEQMLSSAMMERMEQERDLLLQLARDVLTMEEWQRQIAGEAGERADPRQSARSQQALKDAIRKSRERADSLSMISPEAMNAIRKAYGDAMAGVEGVLGELGETDGIGGMAQSGAALNGLAGTLLSTLSGMQNAQGQGGGAGGMMAGLRKLSGKQAAINSATGDLLRQLMQGQKPGGAREGGDGESSQDARREAQAAQKALADELKRLSEQYGKESGEGLNKRVEELEKEARRLSEMLKSPSPDLAERQDRFLARMLQTTLSMHRQDQGKEERTSRTAETTFSGRPQSSQADPFSDLDTFHRMRRRALQGSFPESYRTAVRSYFDSLGVLFLREQGQASQGVSPPGGRSGRQRP